MSRYVDHLVSDARSLLPSRVKRAPNCTEYHRLQSGRLYSFWEYSRDLCEDEIKLSHELLRICGPFGDSSSSFCSINLAT